MAVTRKQISDALLARVVGTGAFVTTGKRNRDPESIPTASMPAAFVVKGSETNLHASRSLPNQRVLNFWIIIYTDAGGSETAVPMDMVDALLESIDAALVPDDPLTNACTLGGLAFSCRIKGETKHAPADVTGKGLALIPVEVIMP
jgi:hypothetical protein